MRDICKWILVMVAFILVVVAVAVSPVYSKQIEAKKGAKQSAIDKAYSLQAEAFKNGGFALMTLPGPDNSITTIMPSGFVLGMPRMEIDKIVAKTDFYKYPKLIQLLDKKGHVVDEFEFGQTVQPGDLVIAWNVDLKSIRFGKYPKSFLGTYPRYFNPDTGFAVSITHAVVETP